MTQPAWPAASGVPAAGLEGAEVARAHPTRRPRVGVLALLGSAVGALSLLGIVGSSLVIVLMSAERPSFLAPTSRPGFFPGWMAGPLHGLWPQLTGNYEALTWLVSALIGGMYVLYVLAIATVDRLDARWTLAALVAIHLIFLLAPPLSYTDVFNYINYGRMGIVHHLNPYTTAPLLEPRGDPSYSLSNWHGLLSPYGPLFTLLTYALVPLGVAASFWALKVVLACASLATLALVWRCARLLGRKPASAVVLVGCNPIVLVWGLGADHNDTLMVLCVVLAIYLILRVPRSSAVGAGGALLTAVFVKASAAVLLPIFLLAGHPRRFLRGALLAAVLLGAASVIAFGLHVPGLSTQSRLVTALGIPNLVGLASGQGGESAAVHTAVSIFLVASIAACAVRVARQRDSWITVSAVALLALIASLSWLVPWYLLWVLPFAALSRSRALRGVVLLLGAYLILAFMPAVSMLAQAIHFRPQATPLGRAHRSEIEALVR